MERCYQRVVVLPTVSWCRIQLSRKMERNKPYGMMGCCQEFARGCQGFASSLVDGGTEFGWLNLEVLVSCKVYFCLRHSYIARFQPSIIPTSFVELVMFQFYEANDITTSCCSLFLPPASEKSDFIKTCCRNDATQPTTPFGGYS